MTLDHLWAGWRSSYISTFDTNGAPAGAADAVAGPAPADGAEPCVFCGIVSSGEPDEVRHVVWTGDKVSVIMNAYPYAPGHVMVLPIRHVRELEDLEPDEAVQLWEAVQAAVAAVKSAYRPEGLNLGVNLGRAAGAGIPAHLHVHVVPRWIGDTNFMTSLASVRVLPEALTESWARLRAAWK